MTIAADTCIYTNHNFTVQSLASKPPVTEGEEAPAAEPGTGAADVAGSAAEAKKAADAEAAAERAAAPTTP